MKPFPPVPMLTINKLADALKASSRCRWAHYRRWTIRPC